MDSTKTDIFAMDNSTTTTPRADTESTPMRDFLLGRSERMATMQTQKQQQKAEWEIITKANGFGQTKVENNRDDKNLRKNYLQSLDYNDQKTFIDLYNKNKDLSFGDVVKKLEDTSETARGGGYRAQINAQNERDAIDYANAIGLGTENLDNRVNENIQGYSTDSRKQALREKVDNLPIEQQMEYVNKYNNDETMQYLYKNAYEMALHQNASLLDNMLDTWEEEDVGPNFGVMMANIPQSTLKLFTASLRGVTNPADTLVGLGKLFATEEGRQALAERYGGWDAIKKTMEEDPVGLASDIMSITGNIAKAGGGATRLVGKATKNPLTSQIGKGIYKVGDAIDDASDFGTSKITSEFLSNKAKELQASTSRISRGAGKYLELTQHPLQSIRKGGSKFLRGGFNADNSASNPESFVGRMKERIGNNFNPSGFSREERTRMQNNPYFQEEYNRAKSMVENSGMPVDPQRITEEGFQKIGDELKQKIEAYENNLNANGKLYENLRNNPTRYNLTDGLNAIKQFFRENGITIVGDDLNFKHGTKEENAKIKEAWDMIQKNALNQTDFKNYHRVRQDIDNMAKYTEGPAVKKYQSVRKMRELLDDVAKREIPGLKKVDEVYKREIDALNKIKEGLVYKDNKKIGEWRDNFYSIMRTLNKQNRQTMKGRLEEQIFPGIAERVEAVDLASKAMKAYQDSPALMKVFGKMLGVSTGGLTAGLSVILGAILDEAVFKPLGEKMRKKALDQIASEMSPEAQQKLVDIEAKLKMGIELKETDKLVLDEARKEIEEAVKQFNDEEKQAKIKQEEKRKQVEAQRKEQEVQEARQKEEFNSFLNDMEKEAPKIEKEEVNYKDLSDETLNELRDDETLPQSERDIIEKELFSRAQFDEATYDAEHERTPVYNMTRTDYIRKIKKLQEEEQRIGKVGKNTVNKDYADKQRKTRETKKERIIEMLGEDYGLEKDQAYDKFLELENAGVEEEGYSQRGGTKNRDKTKEQPILDQLSKKREIRNKQPAFLKSFKQDALDNREFYHTLLDGYEIQPVDKGDRIVKNGETVGNITYKENGTIDSVIVKDLDNFINQKKLLQDLPADTMIKTAGDKYGMTAGEMREQLGIKEPKYQRAYHGSQYDFDKFTMGGNVGKSNGLKYGYGHYVTFDKKLAKGYADKTYTYEGDKNFSDNRIEQATFKTVIETMEDMLTEGKDFETVKETMIQRLRQGHISDSITQRVEQMKESDFEKRNRNFYEIEIPDEKKADTPTGKNYLEDTIISTKEIKKFQETIEKEYPGKGKIFKKNIDENYSDGFGLYDALSNTLGGGIEGQKMASEFLNKIGYDGLKYNDGWENAVIFTDEAMQIVNHERYQKAYHGSIRNFDQFKMNGRVGGTNGMAHGYGHYVAFEEDKARAYADTRYVYKKRNDNGTNGREGQMQMRVATTKIEELLDLGIDFERAKQEVLEKLEKNPTENKTLIEQVKELQESDFEQGTRNLYEVEVPDEKKTNTPTGTNYIDERAKLDNQQVEQFVKAIDKEYPGMGEVFNSLLEKEGYDGYGLYNALSDTFGEGIEGKRLASEFLNKMGYDGLKYEDGKEAVLFTDEAMQITRHEQFQESGRAKQYEKDMKAQEGLSIQNFKNGRTVKEIADDYGIETEIVDKITTPEGERALGMYADGLITLAKDIKESTAPHELLHATFDIVDAKRKQKILDTVKKKLEREGKTDDPEEWLADNFSEYFRTGKFEERGRPTGIKNKIVEFFKRVKDFITGVWSERKTIKNLFDDIIENRIEHDMVNDLLKNEDGYSGAQRLNLYQTSNDEAPSTGLKVPNSGGTSSGRKLNIGNENSSHFVKKLYQLKGQIENGEITKDNFLDQLQNIFREAGKDGQYTKINTGNGSHNLRIADHYANTHNQITHRKRNLGIVIKDLSNPLRPDGLTKDRFLNNDKDKISFNEYVYDKRNLTPEKMNEIVDGIRELIQTGHYTTNLADIVHRTKLAPEKYQIAPMQKSLFDEDLTQPKEEVKETPKTEEVKKKELTDEEVKTVLDKVTKYIPENWEGYSKNPYKNRTNLIKYNDMKHLQEEIKELVGNREITEEQVEKYFNDKKQHPSKTLLSNITYITKYLTGDNDTPLEDIRRRKEMFEDKIKVEGLPSTYDGKVVGGLYETIGKLYDNDLDKWYDNIQKEAKRIQDDIPTDTNSEKFKEYYKEGLPFLEDVTKQELTNIQAYLKINQNIKDSDILKNRRDSNGGHLLKGYIENKKQGGQDIKDRVNKLIAIAGGSPEKLEGNLKTFGGKRPMPSIAVTRGEINPRDFGEIMYVFKKDTVDPKANSANKLYGSDAYTPMFPADSIYSKKTVDYDDLDLTNELGEEIYFSVLRENRNQITDTQARDITEKIMNILQEDQASTEKEIRSAIEEGLRYWKLLEKPDNAEFITTDANLSDDIYDLLQENGATSEQSFIKGDNFADGEDRPLTPENVLRAMREGQDEAKWTARDGSFKDMINIIGTKAYDIERARTKNFANVGAHADLPEWTEPLQTHYDKLVNTIENDFHIKNPRLDIKKAYDSDVQTFKKNLEKINKGYKEVPDDLLSAMIDTVEEGRNIPVRYMESKPHRLVDMYNEIEYLLVPEGQEDKILEIVKGTPLEDKIHPYKDDPGYTTEKQTHKGVAKTLNELQKKYGNVFFSLGGVIFPITALMGMMGEDEEGQEA